MPALTSSSASALGLDPLPASIAAPSSWRQPTATTAYVMARMMGGDAPLMAAITTLQHLVAVVTLPLWVAILWAVLPLS